MMRFGCGAHAGHGGHGRGDSDHATNQTAQEIDPVCGMRVPNSTGFTKVYRAVSYQFCSRVCQDKFHANPDKYAVAGGVGGTHPGHPS